MADHASPQHDDVMTETPDPNEKQPDPLSDGFASQNLRTISDVRRASDDRIVAGVCAGVARHLNIDPIIVRIAVVALTFIGLAGLILYLAAWFLLPEEEADRSVAADWFKLDQNEPQVRAIGLFVAAVLAVVAIVGDGGWGLWWIGWWVIPAAFLFWLLVVRPRQRREELLAVSAGTATDAQPGEWSSDPDVLKTQVDAYSAAKTAQILERKRQRYERRRESRALWRLTLSLIAIAVAVTLILDQQVDVNGSAYIVAALLAVAVGCLVGTVWGNAGGLVGLGLLLTVALMVSSAVPHGRVGDQVREPQTLGGLQSSYRHGIGEFELDLSRFDKPSQLAGRTVHITTGIGQTTVYVPMDVPVTLDAKLRGGEITAFGAQWHGSDNDVRYTDGEGKALHLVINQRFGDMEVIRR
ncbi:MAG TPA: PspC domain-containing protein [Aeromicrobium sp.]|nr:PspC domain-containing protein [Aeromicrobium sp.]